MNAAVLLCAAGLALLLTGAQVLFKLFANTRGLSLEQWQKFLPLGGALGLYFVVFLLYALALRRFELSLLYPIYTALSVLLTFGAGVVLFREAVSMRAVAGCALLIVAVFLLAAPETK